MEKGDGSEESFLVFGFRWLIDNYPDVQLRTLNSVIESFSEGLVIFRAALLLLRIDITPLIAVMQKNIGII